VATTQKTSVAEKNENFEASERQRPGLAGPRLAFDGSPMFGPSAF
jgi:hypothetical protein